MENTCKSCDFSTNLFNINHLIFKQILKFFLILPLLVLMEQIKGFLQCLIHL